MEIKATSNLDDTKWLPVFCVCLQTAVPSRRPSDFQREGVRLPKVYPASPCQQPSTHTGCPQSVPRHSRLRPCTASITHSKPSQSQRSFRRISQSHNFCRHFHQIMLPCSHSATLSSSLLPSAQTAAAAGKSSRTSSPWWRWTSTGTWAASSAKSATRCSMPSTSASKSGNIT